MNIVLIDQHSNFLDELSGLLRKYSEVISLHAFTCAEKGLRHVRTSPPDCVFIEPELGGFRGLSVAAAIRASGEGIAMVFVSDNRNSAIKAWDLSATGYLVKPVDQARLSAVVKKCARVCKEAGAPADTAASQLKAKGETIITGSRTINWRGRQARAFFEYLLDQPGQSANKYVICEALFPAERPERALAKLHYAALHARRSINESNCGFWLRYNVDSYQLITG